MVGTKTQNCTKIHKPTYNDACTSHYVDDRTHMEVRFQKAQPLTTPIAPSVAAVPVKQLEPDVSQSSQVSNLDVGYIENSIDINTNFFDLEENSSS